MRAPADRVGARYPLGLSTKRLEREELGDPGVDIAVRRQLVIDQLCAFAEPALLPAELFALLTGHMIVEVRVAR